MIQVTKTLVLAVLCLCVPLINAYAISDNWVGGDIFNHFTWYSGADPTHGYVYYATQAQSNSWGYTYSVGSQAFIRSDDTSISSGSGRGSVRLQSIETYNRGLFLFDVQHMPYGCGTWPAIWTANLDTWPYGGEIDVLEGVNNNNGNQMTLHTGPGCTFPTGQWDETGTTITGNCDSTTNDAGCSVKDYDTWSYGTNFNANGGGVFALQWEASGIYIWLWARNYIPADITSGNPNVASWGTPRGTFPFGEGCDTSFFYNHHIIIDNTFCGDWAGATFASQCGGVCNTFVQNNPGSFSEAYWTFNSIKVYL